VTDFREAGAGSASCSEAGYLNNCQKTRKTLSEFSVPHGGEYGDLESSRILSRVVS
jgi:hypothetical protein